MSTRGHERSQTRFPMARLTDLELAKAFVLNVAPSFAQVIVRLEADSDLKPSRRRDMHSGLRRVASAIGW